MPKDWSGEFKLMVIGYAKLTNNQLELEYRFNPKRLWRFDYCVKDKKIAIEYDGGGKFGAHTNILGSSNNKEKINWALSNGWKVFQFTTLQFSKHTGTVADMVMKILQGKPFDDETIYLKRRAK